LSAFSTHTDEQLFTLLRNESEAAFNEIYNRYWQKLFVVAAKRLDSQQEAEEVVQDIFYNIWKLRHEIDIKSSAQAYLATAVKFQVFNRIAKNRRTRLDSITENIATENNNALHQLQLSDLQHLLNKMVNNLPEQCRIVYRLSREEGYTRREIAETLEISEKTVANHLTKALGTLRTALQLLILTFII
jgi:RNA polymerase sigma-70 factor (family 1)